MGGGGGNPSLCCAVSLPHICDAHALPLPCRIFVVAGPPPLTLSLSCTVDVFRFPETSNPDSVYTFYVFERGHIYTGKSGLDRFMEIEFTLLCALALDFLLRMVRGVVCGATAWRGENVLARGPWVPTKDTPSVHLFLLFCSRPPAHATAHLPWFRHRWAGGRGQQGLLSVAVVHVRGHRGLLLHCIFPHYAESAEGIRAPRGFAALQGESSSVAHVVHDPWREMFPLGQMMMCTVWAVPCRFTGYPTTPCCYSQVLSPPPHHRCCESVVGADGAAFCACEAASYSYGLPLSLSIALLSGSQHHPAAAAIVCCRCLRYALLLPS